MADDTGVPGVDPDVPAPKAELVDPYPNRAKAAATTDPDKETQIDKQNRLNQLINPQNPPSEQYPDPRKTPEGIEYQKQIESGQQALQAQLDANDKLNKRNDDLNKEYQSKVKELQDEMARIDEERAHPPQLLPLNQRSHEDVNSINNVQWSWPNTLATLGILLAGFAGKRGHGNISNYFLGSFFQAYAAGQEEKMKRLDAHWQKANEEIYKENAERLADYRATLSDERLDLDAKYKLLQSQADVFKDLPMQRAAQQQRLDIIKAQMSSYQQGLREYMRAYKEAWDEKQKLAKTPYMAEYNLYLSSMFHDIYGRWPATPAERDSMMVATEDHPGYPLSEWYQSRIKLGGVDEKGIPRGMKETPKLKPKETKEPETKSESKPEARPTPKSSPRPSETPSATPTPPAWQDNLNQYMDERMKQARNNP